MVVLMVVRKAAAGTGVITVRAGGAAADAAAAAHVAAIVRDKRQTTLMRTHKGKRRRRVHESKFILHPPIHQILLLPFLLPFFLLLLVPLLTRFPSISILIIENQTAIVHITPILPSSLHPFLSLQKSVLAFLLQVGAGGGRGGGRGGGNRRGRGVRDVRGTRLRPDATPTLGRGLPTIPFPIATAAAAAAAAAAADPPQGGHGGVAFEGGGISSERRSRPRGGAVGRGRVLHVFVVEGEELGSSRGALPGHASNVTDEVGPVAAELRMEVSAGVDALGDASEAVEVELPLEGGDFVV